VLEEKKMGSRSAIKDMVVGLVSGYVGTKLMDPVTTKLYDISSEADKQQEKAVSPGVAYNIAAQKMSSAVGITLTDEQTQAAGQAMHWGLGLTGGNFYVLLRRITSIGPVAAGLVTALVLWAGVDEGANWFFNFSAPPEAYPLSTHIRGFAGHIVLGLTIAATAELLLMDDM